MTAPFELADDSVVVVIGTGAGGGVLANELAQRGVSVVALEAGGRYLPEDYLNDAFYFEKGLFGFAFGQAHAMGDDASASPARGNVSACRWNILGDAIDFQQRFDLSLEIGPGEPSLLDRYRSVAFYYR